MSGNGSAFSNYQSTNGGGSGSSSAPSGAFPTTYTPWPGITQTQLRQTLPVDQSEIPAPPPNSGNLNPNVAFGGSPPAVSSGGVTNVQTEFQQLLQNYVSDPNYMPQFQDQLIQGGFLNPASHGALGYTPGSMVPGDATWSAFRDLLLEASATGTSWQQLLGQNIQNHVGEQKFNLSKTYDRISVPTPDDARATLTSIMEQQLGRKPTNAEIAQFSGQLQQAAQSNPQHVTDTYDLSAFLNSSRSNAPVGSFAYGLSGLPHTEKTTGGFNPEAQAQSYIYQHDGKELGQVNADQIFNLFLDMIGSGGGANGG